MASLTVPYVQSRVYMDTIVTIQVPRPTQPPVRDMVERAFGWFREVEARCSRFEPESDLSRLYARPGVAVEVSDLLFRAIGFARSVADVTGGAFDPTVGRLMEQRGFRHNYRTGAASESMHAVASADYKSIELDATNRTVTLLEPLVLDLGAVAKGLAIDLAAAELRELDGFLINAGGDIYVHGSDADGAAWRIGVKDPADPARLFTTFSLSNGAVCTSGGYERPADDAVQHHIVVPASGVSPADVASVTVLSASAMLSDALSTAAFVLGAEPGIALLEQQGVEGLIIDSCGGAAVTQGLQRYM